MRLIFSTTPVDKAAEIANCLVKEKLVACVNIIPKIRSIYSWQNEICDEEESILLMKTTSGKVQSLSNRLKQLHPYDVPEIVSVPINENEGNPDYMKWVRDWVSK